MTWVTYFPSYIIIIISSITFYLCALLFSLHVYKGGIFWTCGILAWILQLNFPNLKTQNWKLIRRFFKTLWILGYFRFDLWILLCLLHSWLGELHETTLPDRIPGFIYALNS